MNLRLLISITMTISSDGRIVEQ